MPIGNAAELNAWLCLDRVPGLGPVRGAKLLSRHPVARLTSLPVPELLSLGLTELQAHALVHPDEAAMAAAWAWLERPNRHLITLTSDNQLFCASRSIFS